jgi:hypothetical protein
VDFRSFLLARWGRGGGGGFVELARFNFVVGGLSQFFV